MHMCMALNRGTRMRQRVEGSAWRSTVPESPCAGTSPGLPAIAAAGSRTVNGLARMAETQWGDASSAPLGWRATGRQAPARGISSTPSTPKGNPRWSRKLRSLARTCTRSSTSGDPACEAQGHAGRNPGGCGRGSMAAQDVPRHGCSRSNAIGVDARIDSFETPSPRQALSTRRWPRCVRSRRT